MVVLDYLIGFGFLLLLVFIILEFSHRINLISVPLLIIAGMLIGPHGVGLVNKFQGLEFFAELGFLFLVFLAGLDIKGIKNVKWKEVGKLGCVMATISFVAGFSVVYAMGYRPPLYLLATPLIVGTVFQSSSVGEIIPLVNFTAKLKDKIGNTLIPTVVLLDTISLIGLSVILEWEKNSNIFHLFVFVLSLSLFVILGARYIPYLGRWIFNRYKSSYEEMEVVFFMAVLFSMIGISELIGLEPIVASFLTGLFLGETMVGEEIYKKLNTIGKGFLIPIFFIVVGMDSNLSIFLQGINYLLLVIFVTGGLMVSKLLGGYLYSRLYRKDLPLIGIVFFPQLGATLVATKIGMEYGLIDEPLFTSIVIMAIVTALITPFLIPRLFGKSEKAMMQRHSVIIGGGVIGEYAAAALKLLEREFIIVEKDKTQCEYLREKGYSCILGDATRENVMKAANIDVAKYAFVFLPSSRNVVTLCRAIHKRNSECKIIARVHSEKERNLLKDIVEEILYPERIAGMNVIWYIMKLVEEEKKKSRNKGGYE